MSLRAPFSARSQAAAAPSSIAAHARACSSPSTSRPSTPACRAAGIDPVREPIPVAPAAHYHMGGILTDAQGRTTVDGLWACGEVASTGAHGANRLASNSLLEAVVFGARVARDIAASFADGQAAQAARDPRHGERLASRATRPSRDCGRPWPPMSAWSATRLRSRTRLVTILALEHEARGDRRLANMLSTAKLIAAGALQRQESRGAHFRSDYPMPEERLAKRSFLTLADANAIAAKRRKATRSHANCMPRRSALHSMHERDASFPLKLPPLLVEQAVATALDEDLGSRRRHHHRLDHSGRSARRSGNRAAQAGNRRRARSRRSRVQGARSRRALQTDRR